MALQCPTNIFSTDFAESYHQVIQVIYKAPAVNGDGGNSQVKLF